MNCGPVDYTAALRLFPELAQGDPIAARALLVKDGKYRFVLRSVLRDLMAYRTIMANAEATASTVVILPEEPPQFATAPAYTPPPPIVLAPDRLPTTTTIGEILSRATDPRVIVCTAHERDNPRLMGEINEMARSKGLMVRFSP